MKVIGINGSPRKGWNTDTLVKKALEGATAAGAETELVELYAEPIKGCLECLTRPKSSINTPRNSPSTSRSATKWASDSSKKPAS